MNTASILRAAFLADSLGLGSHWIYNQGKLNRLYPEGTFDFDDPRSNYHPNRNRGQFTHFGDQMLVLLRSLVASQKWSPSLTQEIFREAMANYDGYLDKATEDSLASFPKIPGSNANDLSGASRIFPLLLLELPLEELVVAARQQTEMTHGDPMVVDTAEFLVRTIDALKKETNLEVALTKAATANYTALPASKWLEQAKAAAEAGNLNQSASEFGLTCHIPEAFPTTFQYLFHWIAQGSEKSSQALLSILSANNLAGGDTSARAILIAALLVAAGCPLSHELYQKLHHSSSIDKLISLVSPPSKKLPFEKVSFSGANGDSLDARLELPSGPLKGTAIFAHCFTCGKTSQAATSISRALASFGIATLRFDFTGLGNSNGDFANTSFLSNIDDLIAASEYLRTHYQAPTLLVGHSLGGAAVLAAANRVPEVTHVATIGAPADPEHVTHLFEDDLSSIEEKGRATVKLAGRPFEIGKKFLDDLKEYNQPEKIAALKRNLLVMHSPSDSIVGIENAGQIYSAAKHPKSFLSLPEADHLLTNPAQATYVARIISTWINKESNNA